jgi:hypothetical protein
MKGGESMENFLVEIFVKAFAKAFVAALVKTTVSWFKRRIAPTSDKLAEKDENGDLLIDLVLVVLDASSRDLSSSYRRTLKNPPKFSSSENSGVFR